MSLSTKGILTNVVLIAVGAGIAYLLFGWQRRSQPPAPPAPAEAPERRAVAVGPGGVIYMGEGRRIHANHETWTVRAPVQALAVDRQARLFVAYATQVEVFDAKRESLHVWGRTATEGFRHITGIAVDGDDVFVADAGSRLIFRYSTDGVLRNTIGDVAADPDHLGFILPTFFLDCWPHKGVLYVNNPGRLRVEMFGYDGARQGHWGKPGFEPEEFPGCCNPTNVAVLPDGRVVVSQKGKPLVKFFSAKGAFEQAFGEAVFGPRDRGIDLAVMPDGRVVTATASKGIIYIEAKPAAGASGE